MLLKTDKLARRFTVLQPTAMWETGKDSGKLMDQQLKRQRVTSGFSLVAVIKNKRRKVTPEKKPQRLKQNFQKLHETEPSELEIETVSLVSSRKMILKE